MAEPKQHHFVTKAYLEGFAPEDGSRLFIYTRNKPGFFRAHPDKIAKIHNYYSQKRPDGTIDNKLEMLLATQVEGPGIGVLRRLNAGHYKISGSARGRLAFMMAIQEYRVPWMRQTMEDSMKAVQQRIMTSMIDRPGFLEQRINEISAEEGRETNLTADDIRHCFRSGQIGLASNPGSSLWAMGAVAEKITDIYFGLRWTVLESKVASFVTSDCPVHRFYSPVAPQRPYVGLADDRIQVRFPISRRRMLVAEHDFKRMGMWRKLTDRGLRRRAAQLRAAASEIGFKIVEAAEVKELNEHTISMASRIVISPEEMPEISALFQGDCQNIRQVVDDLPGGLIRMQTVYPKRKASRAIGSSGLANKRTSNPSISVR